jgi:hypothetical protein
MGATELAYFVLGLATGIGVAALAVAMQPRLRLAGGLPAQAAVESALQPFIERAIMASYRVSEATADAGLGTLSGAAKKSLADSTYRLLPERVGDFDLTVAKSLVPPERFQTLVQDAFDRFDRFYLLYHAHFDAAYRTRGTAASANGEKPPGSAGADPQVAA